MGYANNYYREWLFDVTVRREREGGGRRERGRGGREGGREIAIF